MKRISVVGCGFVGLSLAVIAANKGIHVVAVDIDKQKIKKLNSGKGTFFEPYLNSILNKVLKKNLKFTTDINEAISNSDITFVCVGTPSKPKGDSNLSYVQQAAKSIGKSLRNKKNYHTIVIKSTVVPNTTNSIIKPILERESKKTEGKDFGLIANPEFLKEGSAVADTENPHLIVIGADSNKPVKILESLYKKIHQRNLPEIIKTNIETAELIKYANNAFLATKISFINSIANICQNIPNTDVNTIAKAIGKDPRIGPLFLQAGPGYGGSCFPKDVNALISFSRKLGYQPLLIEATRDVNILQAKKVLKLIKSEIGNLKGKTISVLGLAFKKNTDDIRESVSINLINLLKKEGAKISAHDPKAIENSKKVLGSKVSFCERISDCLKGSQCGVIMTDWDEYKKLKQSSVDLMKNKLFIDARRVLVKNTFNSKTRIIALGKG